MVTRARVGTFKPNPRYAGAATTTPAASSNPPVSPIPRSVNQALQDPHWRQAMQSEYDALLDNDTWTLVPRPPDAHVVSGKWVFRHKFKADGTFDRYKARWVVRGFTQRAGMNYGETYCPVVKPATVRTVLTLAAQRCWPVHQLDVNNAFLHGVLEEQVYARQPAGFVNKSSPDSVCRLSKSLYGLKQAPRASYMQLATFLGSLGFKPTRSDSSLFVLRHGTDSVYLLLYVDGIVLTASSDTLMRQVINDINAEFALKDMGPIHYFLGIQVQRQADGFFLQQQQYALDLLERAGMADCRPCDTPIDTAGKLSSETGTPLSVADASAYRSMVGAL
jgi:histone deacetylase 1/2